MEELRQKIIALQGNLRDKLLNDDDIHRGIEIKFITDYASYYLPILELMQRELDNLNVH